MSHPAAFPWTFLPPLAPGERRADYFTWPDAPLAGLRWPYFAIHGAAPGPATAITAAIHGGEYPGPLAAQRLGRTLDPATLRGALLILPLINLPSFWARTAFTTPDDGKNLNRLFPGTPDGTFGDVLAHRLVGEVFGPAEALIDLHSGDIFEALSNHVGRHRSDDPALDELTARMAAAFGLPYIETYPPPAQPSRSTTGTMTRLGKPALLVEVGGNGLASAANVDRVHDGVVSTLRALGHLPGEPLPNRSRAVSSAASIAAPATGLWRPTVELEQVVAAGELVGTLTDPLGEEIARVTAPVGGMVLHYLTSLVAHEGNELMHLVVPQE